MSRAIPTLGYGSRREAILALWREGQSIQQIAVEIGIPVGQVTSVLCRFAGGEDKYAGRYDGRYRVPTRQICVPSETLDRLGADARRRGIPVEQLCRSLLAEIVGDQLVDAILDDGAGS